MWPRLSRAGGKARGLLGYHVLAGNKDRLLSLDLGLREFGLLDDKERFRRYRRFLCQARAIDRGKGAVLGEKLLEEEHTNHFGSAFEKAA